MKNKKYTITTDQLNNSGTITIDSSMVLYQTTIAQGLVSGVIYPKEIQLINNCGVDIEYTFMSNDNEYSDYLLDSTNYSFISLPNNYTLENDNVFKRCKRFLIKKESGIATSDIRIDFINYVEFEIRWV
jgi:hypothetical protein